MLKGIGIDVVYVATIESMLDAQTEESLRDVFTEHEIGICRSSPNAVERFATRFAAKEATMKALGLGWQENGVDWTDIEITSDSGDGPALGLAGAAEVRATELGVRKTWVSLSHEEGIAVALVILEG